MQGTGDPTHPTSSTDGAERSAHPHGFDEHGFERLVDAAIEAELATGEREETEEKAKRHILVRIGIILAGLLVTFAGVLMLVLPGPGLVVVIAGLGILSTEVSWAERLLAYAKEKSRVEEVTAQRPWIKPVSIVVTVIAVVASAAYGVMAFTGD